MRAPAWLFGLGIVVASMALLVACGGGPAGKFGNIKAGEMPPGEEWTGVYYNPVYGYMHLIEQQDGSGIVGKWKRTDGSHWGELSGTVEGNVMQYTWKEHEYGAVGVNGNSKGNGVFVYKMGEAAPELNGQYSLEDSDQVGQWHCVKQKNMKPDFNSITGDVPPDAPATQDKWQ
jgi:hypothetical protein